ncbi:MAG: copper amine oxidase N-terminal domain-containing protein [Oscillospiraceae bacterium]|nr:copper amine oxidase N-terminal domain-containing protein [Oscillospiraceae bacterium]
MKRLNRTLSLMLAASTLMASSALASNTGASTSPALRVNGAVVDYPDARPYVDENNRTMTPVRFVTEQLGADVSWDGATRTASIRKNDRTVEITIGSPELRITAEDGTTESVTMDTAAVLQDGRTYVPIRYVAEALGAYVDYSDAFQTAGIYLDKLSAEEIDQLREYDYTRPNNAIGYEEYKASSTPEQTEYFFGTYRDTFGNFANAREYLYHQFTPSPVKYHCDDLGETVTAESADSFYDAIAREAAAELGYQSERLKVEFKADTSCIHQADCHNRTTTTVRGFLCVKLHVNLTKLTQEEKVMIGKLGITKAPANQLLTFPVDAHMNTLSGKNVTLRTLVHLIHMDQ